MSYKTLHGAPARAAEAARIRSKHPGHVPVIVERAATAHADIPDVAKRKYLISRDATFGELMAAVRVRLSVPRDKALFWFVAGSTLVPTSSVMADIDRRFAGEDGLLYVTYTGESTFGQ